MEDLYSQPSEEDPISEPRVLKLLSYNIQVGINTRHFADYFMAGWRHFFPNKKRLINLKNISHILKPYDLVALQEVDGGSLRSSYINHVEFLANYSGFPYWYHQCNRNLGKLAQHSNGLLAKLPVVQIINHKLPGLIPGRGAIEAVIGDQDNINHQLRIIVAHLSISPRARRLQVQYLASKIINYPYVVIMGDLNCSGQDLLAQFSKHNVILKTVNEHTSATFPSWQPKHQYDHILVSPKIDILSQQILPNPISDHLPIALEISIPGSILGPIKNPGQKVKHYHPTRITNHLDKYHGTDYD